MTRARRTRAKFSGNYEPGGLFSWFVVVSVHYTLPPSILSGWTNEEDALMEVKRLGKAFPDIALHVFVYDRRNFETDTGLDVNDPKNWSTPEVMLEQILAVYSTPRKPKQKQIWSGDPPVQCDLCLVELEPGGVFYDANTSRGWGYFCQRCFDELGLQLGIGFGQKYVLQADGSWLRAG